MTAPTQRELVLAAQYARAGHDVGGARRKPRPAVVEAVSVPVCRCGAYEPIGLTTTSDGERGQW